MFSLKILQLHNRITFVTIFVAIILFVSIAIFRSLMINVAQILLVDGLISDYSRLYIARNIFTHPIISEPFAQMPLSLCRIDIATNAFDSASETCRELDLKTLVGIGDIYVRQGNPEIALNIYQLANQLHPNSALVFSRLGDTYSQGKSEAVEAYKQAIQLAASGDKSLSILDLADIHVQLAQNYFWWEAYQQTISESKLAIALSPTYSYAYRLQAVSYAKLGQFELAEHTVQKAIQVDSSFWPYLEWGDIYHIQGQILQASDKYKESVRLADVQNQFRGYDRLCRLYLEIEDEKNSVDFCKKLVELHPDQPESLILLGDAYVVAKNITAAEGQYLRVLEIEPQNPLAIQKLQKK